MAQNPNPNTSTTDKYVSRLRENVTGLLAAVIVLSMVGLLIIPFALGYINTKDSVGFANVKDLLSFINPLVGVVIGYYFNKASTEARAESAENAAKQANETVKATVKANNDAVQSSVTANEQAGQATQQAAQATQQAQQATEQAAQATAKADEAATVTREVFVPAFQKALQAQTPAAPTGEAFRPDDPNAREMAPAPGPALDDQTRSTLEAALARAKQLAGMP